MRAIHALTFLAALFLVPAAWAQDSHPAGRATEARSTNSTESASHRAGGRNRNFQPPTTDPLPGVRHPGDNVCYLMRSYFVAREHPASDAVKPAGYATCIPAITFQMKSVGQRVKPPE